MTRRIAVGAAEFAVVDDKDSFWDKVGAEAWEPETLAAVAALARPGVTFVDIGAWIGPISLLAAARGASVLAFEPDPRAFELLEANIAANPALSGRIAARRRAVAPAPGPIRLGSPRKPGDSMGSILFADRALATWEAETVTPAEVAEALAAPPVVLKIDTEGAEYALLPRLAPLLGASTEAAIIAFHPRLLLGAGRAQAAVDQLTAEALSAMAGFEATALDASPADGPEPVSTNRNCTVLFRRPRPPLAGPQIRL